MGLFEPKTKEYSDLNRQSITEIQITTEEVKQETEEVKQEVNTMQSEPFNGSDPGLVPASDDSSQAKFLRGDGNWATPSGGGSGGTSDYNDLVNKPAINGIELTKNSTASEVGLATKNDLPDLSDYALKSDIPDTSDFATKEEIPDVSGFLTEETDPTVPSWAKTPSKPTYIASEVGLGNVNNTSDADKPVSTAQQTALNAKQDKMQYDSLPTASADYLGKVFEYTGATGNGLTHGYFYECVSDGESTPTYSWAQTNVQPSSGGGGGSYTEYSTDEKIVGTWIDGSPIWQKTIDTGALPNASDKSIAHGISNLGYVISISGTATNPTSGACIPIQYIDGSGNSQHYIRTFVNSTAISIRTNYDARSASVSYVTIQYTKTS